MTNPFTFTWFAERDGNIGRVTERRPNGTESRWEMPSHLVPAFIRARRQLMSHKMSTLMGMDPRPDHDYDYLITQEENLDVTNTPDPRRFRTDDPK